MTQLDLDLDLFDGVSAMCRDSDPETSRLAAKGVNIKKSLKLALQTLREAEDGLTDHELAAKTGYQHNSIGKRRTDLRNLGLVVDSGKRRKAPSGAYAIVWKAL
jgi:transcription initiation factor IIE alpha subunit